MAYDARSASTATTSWIFRRTTTSGSRGTARSSAHFRAAQPCRLGRRTSVGRRPSRTPRASETALATLTGREAALLFSSGYLAALGAIGGLASCVDAAYSDALNHACLIDGLRATKLERTIYQHLLLPSQRTPAALVVSETLFGMDGDAVDAGALVASLGDGDVALLDEAHALGIVGAHGGGLAAGIDDPRVVVIGTLSKAFGALGGFVAGPQTVIELLRNTARTFIFDTALPPAVAAAALASVAIVRSSEGDALRVRLVERSAYLRARLEAMGRPAAGTGPVVPIVIGDSTQTVALADELARRGVRVPAIRPPTVPSGTARLRITVRADHTSEEMDVPLRGPGRGAAAPGVIVNKLTGDST